MACGHPQSAVCVLVVLQLSTVIKLVYKVHLLSLTVTTVLGL